MIGNISQWLLNVSDGISRRAIQNIVAPIGDRMSSHLVTSATLAITSGGSALARTTGIVYAFCNGVPVTRTAGNMAALSGTVVNATFNVYCFFIDSAGAVTTQMGTAGSTYSRVVFPTVPNFQAQIGFVIINPTGTGNFVGGTTPLDDATVIPNAVYINTVGPADPTILVGSF